MLAPVILFAYSRPAHTLQTLTALAQNEGADQTELFIFCDGAKPNANETTLQRITEVRQLIRSKQWCKEIHIIESTTNRGLAASIVAGLTQIINQYGRAIILEDDIITHKGFLQYMNTALDMYANDPQVFGIAGYAFPVPQHLPDTFFLPIVSSWGWATWKRAWDYFKNDAIYFDNYLKNNQLQKKFNFGHHGNYEILQGKIQGKIDSWAVCWYASMFMEQGLYLFPRQSLVSNIGFDSTGTNCDEDPFYATHSKTDFVQVNRQPPVLDSKIVKQVAQRLSKHFATKSLLVRIINRLGRIKNKLFIEKNISEM